MISMAARLVCFLVVSFITLNVRAEYRVFELSIENESGQARTVLSTLDDIQYPSYFPVKKTDKVTIQDSWMCWKRSDVSQDPAQRYCPNPRGPASAPTGPKPGAK
ncbi:MAG: hypothetical protein V4760_13485 [Bdellovibrionota bacterium]